MLAVSRLRWRDEYAMSSDAAVPADAERFEVSHVRGIPVADLVPSDAIRIREWPNRLGVYEHGSDEDLVHWTPSIGLAPPGGTLLVDRAANDELRTYPHADLEERVQWFRRFLKTLAQTRGVTPAIDPPAACTIVLTPGIDAGTLQAASDAFPAAIGPIPGRLAEFPGGIQLSLSDTAWQRRDAYAELVQDVVRGSS